MSENSKIDMDVIRQDAQDSEGLMRYAAYKTDKKDKALSKKLLTAADSLKEVVKHVAERIET